MRAIHFLLFWMRKPPTLELPTLSFVPHASPASGISWLLLTIPLHRKRVSPYCDADDTPAVISPMICSAATLGLITPGQVHAMHIFFASAPPFGGDSLFCKPPRAQVPLISILTLVITFIYSTMYRGLPWSQYVMHLTEPLFFLTLLMHLDMRTYTGSYCIVLWSHSPAPSSFPFYLPHLPPYPMTHRPPQSWAIAVISLACTLSCCPLCLYNHLHLEASTYGLFHFNHVCFTKTT